MRNVRTAGTDRHHAAVLNTERSVVGVDPARAEWVKPADGIAGVSKEATDSSSATRSTRSGHPVGAPTHNRCGGTDYSDMWPGTHTADRSPIFYCESVVPGNPNAGMPPVVSRKVMPAGNMRRPGLLCNPGRCCLSVNANHATGTAPFTTAGLAGKIWARALSLTRGAVDIHRVSEPPSLFTTAGPGPTPDGGPDPAVITRYPLPCGVHPQNTPPGPLPIDAQAPPWFLAGSYASRRLAVTNEMMSRTAAIPAK